MVCSIADDAAISDGVGAADADVDGWAWTGEGYDSETDGTQLQYKLNIDFCFPSSFEMVEGNDKQYLSKLHVSKLADYVILYCELHDPSVIGNNFLTNIIQRTKYI